MTVFIRTFFSKIQIGKRVRSNSSGRITEQNIDTHVFLGRQIINQNNLK